MYSSAWLLFLASFNCWLSSAFGRNLILKVGFLLLVVSVGRWILFPV